MVRPLHHLLSQTYNNDSCESKFWHKPCVSTMTNKGVSEEQEDEKEGRKEGRKEGNILFNNALLLAVILVSDIR